MHDGKGQEAVLRLVRGYISDLIKAGFGVWVISHTKDKTIKEKGMTEEEGYQILTSSLSNKYDSVFADMFDMVLTGYKDRDVIDGKITRTARKLAFRGSYTVDAGCRVAGKYLPEELEFLDDEKESAKLFVDTVKEALRQTCEMDEDEYKKAEVEENARLSNIRLTEEELHKEEEVVEAPKKTKKAPKKEEGFDKEDAIEKIKAKFMSDATYKGKVKEYLTKIKIRDIKLLNEEQLKVLLGGVDK